MTDPQRRLVLLRHAKAAWPRDVADVDRPLTDRGRTDAAAAGRWLAQHDPAIEVVRCSTAVRAQQTWRLAHPEIPAAPQVDYDERIYAASPEQLLQVVRALPSTAMTALLIGHNPGLEDLAGLLTGEPTELRTAGIAVLLMRDGWAEAGPEQADPETTVTPRG
ncbi:histidine phosphatase family protein [Saccharopolyspora cebuensis]|uniref:Histidine phosphatase family protein n=1 Tax=Saccharopolyspora cebuensis TaxID=418759 RepID=A0ABV4CJZ2_9PSEU